MNHHTVLGLSLGTRRIGVAIVRNGELLEWRVKEFRGIWNERKVEAVAFYVLKLCGLYGASTIAMKVPKQRRTKTGPSYVLAELTHYSESQNIPLITYSLSELRKYYSEGDRITKDDARKCLVARFPELKHDFKRDSRNLNSYYDSMFEAIAVAIAVGDGNLSDESMKTNEISDNGKNRIY